MNAYKYFWTEATGLNADLARHDEAINRIKSLIENADGASLISAYQYLLSIAEQSRANVVEQMGRKNG